MNWDWFNTGAGAASMVGLIVTLGAIMQAVITGRSTRRLQADIHASTQLTLTDMRKGFAESQEKMDENWQRTLERMDQRWQEAFERMDQRADERHRATLTAIEALRRP